MEKQSRLLIISIIALVCLLLSTIAFAQTQATVDHVVYDHLGAPYTASSHGKPWGAHQGQLHGVPTYYDWAQGARPGSWFDFTGTNKKAITTWGEIYEDLNGSPEKNCRIQIRNHTLYGLVNGTWIALEGGSQNGVQASHFAENFNGPGGGTPDTRNESNNGGGLSWTAKDGFNIHWWTTKWPRADIPANVEAFFIYAELRLIPNTNPNVDLSKVKYLAGVSADYYTNNTEAGYGPFPSLSISRHKYITKDWQAYTSYITRVKPTTEAQYKSDILAKVLPPNVTNGTTNNVAVTAVNLTPTSISVYKSSTTTLQASISPANATNKNVIWSSSNALVATVNAQGVVTALVTGTTTITAKTVDGNFTATTSITVTEPIEGTDYFEDFNDGLAQGWQKTTGTWTLSNNEYNNTTSTEEEISFYGGAIFTNYTFSAKANPSWDNEFGLVYNYQDANNFLALVLDVNPKNAYIKQKVDGTWTTLATSTYTGGAGQWNTIEVTVDNGKSSVKINGSAVFTTVTTSQFITGKIGLYSWYNPVKFDDVDVKSNTIITALETTAELSNTAYPNPFTTHIQLSFEQSWYLYNSTGQLIKSGTSQIINSQDLEAGLYMLQLNNGSIIKLIKND